MSLILGIYGAGGLGREIAVLAQQICKEKNSWQEIIFIDDVKDDESINGIMVYSYEAAKERFRNNLEIVIGIGEPASREKLERKIKHDGYEMATLIHPQVYIPDSSRVGKGTVIQIGCFISCNVIIGDNVYIQPNTNIGHDDILKNGCIVSGLCNLAGHVSIGVNTYLGLSSCIKEGVSVGDNTIIGMGSVVYKELPSDVVAMGNPARPMKANEDRKVFK